MIQNYKFVRLVQQRIKELEDQEVRLGEQLNFIGEELRGLRKAVGDAYALDSMEPEPLRRVNLSVSEERPANWTISAAILDILDLAGSKGLNIREIIAGLSINRIHFKSKHSISVLLARLHKRGWVINVQRRWYRPKAYEGLPLHHSQTAAPENIAHAPVSMMDTHIAAASGEK